MPAAMMDTVGQLLMTMPPKGAYGTALNMLSAAEAPRDSAVIHNKKYQDARQARMADCQQHCANFADEIQAAVGMVSDAFARRIEFTKHRVPSIVLYTERQVKEVKGFCFAGRNDSVLGFDKAYNRGAIYVTPRVYKKAALRRKRTLDTPVFLGLILYTGTPILRHITTFFRDWLADWLTVILRNLQSAQTRRQPCAK